MQDRTTPAAEHAAHLDGMTGARDLLGGAVNASRDGVAWYEQWQRFYLQALSSWTDSLAIGLREVEQAHTPMELLEVPSNIVNRQLQDLSRQWCATMENLGH